MAAANALRIWGHNPTIAAAAAAAMATAAATSSDFPQTPGVDPSKDSSVNGAPMSINSSSSSSQLPILFYPAYHSAPSRFPDCITTGRADSVLSRVNTSSAPMGNNFPSIFQVSTGSAASFSKTLEASLSSLRPSPSSSSSSSLASFIPSSSSVSSRQSSSAFGHGTGLFELSRSLHGGGLELRQLPNKAPGSSTSSSISSSSSSLNTPSPPSVSSLCTSGSKLTPSSHSTSSIFSSAAVFVPLSSIYLNGSFPVPLQPINYSQSHISFPSLFTSVSNAPTGLRWMSGVEVIPAPAPPRSSSLVEQTAGQPRSLHTWHNPKPGSGGLDGGGNERQGAERGSKKPVITVVLLGWLGCQQKHLRRYAEWYTSQGMHAVTFVVPMSSVLSLGPDGKAEKHVDRLVEQLERWIQSECSKSDGTSQEGHTPIERSLIFHTFSNTGWLTYGAVLERLKKQVPDAFKCIRGCIIDSAPVVDPDPQVWASGFSAAILKKRSNSTLSNEKTAARVKVDLGDGLEAVIDASEIPSGQQSPSEAALKKVLEKFFSVFLQIPAIRRRLTEVTSILQKEQPKCPQLYIYSTSDDVIPHARVEAFMQMQKQDGRVVIGHRMDGSPHVDHFRAAPHIYTGQLQKFLNCCFSRNGTEKLATDQPCQ